MRTVNVAKLKDQLSKYLAFAKSGEEVVIRDRNLPVAKLVPLRAEGADAEKLKLVAAEKLRLPNAPLGRCIVQRGAFRRPPLTVKASQGVEGRLTGLADLYQLETRTRPAVIRRVRGVESQIVAEENHSDRSRRDRVLWSRRQALGAPLIYSLWVSWPE